MKKKILFGAIFSICIIVLVNTTSAVEYKTTIDYNNNLLESKLENINIFIEKLRTTNQDKNVKPIDLKFSNELMELSNELSKLRISIVENTFVPKPVINLLDLLISLLYSMIGTLIGWLVGKTIGPLIAKLILTNCIGCGLCVEVCPVIAIPNTLIGFISNLAKIDEDKCNGCGECIRICSYNAIKLIKK
jgi:ferredoxin